VINERGENLGVLKLTEALKLAQSGLDLIEIAPQAKPPVARLMSFDKYRYQREKEEKRERLAQKTAGPKQIQISARSARNDLQIKVRQLEKFLGEGHQIYIQMRLRGREKGNKDWARMKLGEFLGMITPEYKVISEPKFGGYGVGVTIIKK